MRLIIPKTRMKQGITIEQAREMMLQVKKSLYMVSELFHAPDAMATSELFKELFDDITDIARLYELMIDNFIDQVKDLSVDNFSFLTYESLYGTDNPYQLGNLKGIYRGLQNKYNNSLRFINKMDEYNYMELYDEYYNQAREANPLAIKYVEEVAEVFHPRRNRLEDEYSQVCEHRIDFWKCLKGLPKETYELVEEGEQIELVSGTGEIIMDL